MRKVEKSLLQQPHWLLCFCIAVIANVQIAASGEELAWELTQKHRFYGQEIIHLTRRGMKVDQTKFSTSFIQKTGDDTYYCYSKANKVLFVGHGDSASEMARIEVLASLSTHSLELFDWSRMQWKKEKTAKMFGLPVEEYVAQRTNFRWEIWVTRALNMPEWMTDEHDRWAKLPHLNGMPLKATLFNQSGAKTEVLVTLGVRKIKPSDVDFTCPTGFKRVNNLTSVMAAQSDSFLKDVEESLGH